MEGAEHYRKAEELAAAALMHNTEDPRDMRIAEVTAWIAQVHATLALAAAQAMGTVEKHMGDSSRITEWGRVLNWDTAPRRTPRCDVWKHNNGVAYQCFGEPGHDGEHDFEGIPF